MVWGSRFLKGAGYPVGSWRRIGQKLFARLVSRITRSPVTDQPTTGTEAMAAATSASDSSWSTISPDR